MNSVPLLRAVIVDDEPLARARIREFLAHESDITIVGEAADGAAAIDLLEETAPDLLFLDVQMPEVDGFGVLRILGADRAPVTLFVTAFDQYALRAFEAHALDYLLKPFDRERFALAVTRARELIRGRRAGGDFDDRLAAAIRQTAPTAWADRLAAKVGTRTILLRAEQVDYVEAAGNYLRLWVGPDRYHLRETLQSLEARIDPAKFLRIHRSFLVNLDRVREVEPYFHGDAILKLHDGRKLTLSRTYRARFEERFGLADGPPRPAPDRPVP
jgi:two-component system, LytTR family, response regulator